MVCMRNLKILTIDDDMNNLYTLECILEQLDNVEVIQASSAKEGLELIKKIDIHLILVDIQMPFMNGFEFVEELNLMQLNEDIPVVFLTAYYKSEEFQAKGYKLGAFDYMTKPIDEDRLLNKVQLYSKLHHKNELLKEANEKLSVLIAKNEA